MSFQDTKEQLLVELRRDLRANRYTYERYNWLLVVSEWKIIQRYFAILMIIEDKFGDARYQFKKSVYRTIKRVPGVVFIYRRSKAVCGKH